MGDAPQAALLNHVDTTSDAALIIGLAITCNPQEAPRTGERHSDIYSSKELPTPGAIPDDGNATDNNDRDKVFYHFQAPGDPTPAATWVAMGLATTLFLLLLPCVPRVPRR